MTDSATRFLCRETDFLATAMPPFGLERKFFAGCQILDFVGRSVKFQLAALDRPDELEFHRRELVQDPETAGTNRVRELYKESGGIAPKTNPWWKFW